MSASWLACMLTLDRWVPKWTLFIVLIICMACISDICRNLPILNRHSYLAIKPKSVVCTMSGNVSDNGVILLRK